MGGYPVRVAVGDSNVIGKRHAHAQAMVNGQWEWLEYSFLGAIKTGRKDNFYPDKFETIKSFMYKYVK